MPANPPVTRRMVHTLEPNGGVTISKDLVAEMVPGTGAVSLSVGPLSALDVPSLMRELDRYPYGCSEQLVSRALPLLYLSELGGNDLDLDGSVKDRLSDTVQRLLARQDTSGAFGLWNSYSGDLWLSSYVTDFLLRAREKGFAVPEGALNQAVDYLRNQVGNSPYVQQGRGEDVAYALYTLARAGRAPAGDLKYFADTKIGDFGTAMARAQIAAALGMLGDKPRANAAFRSAADLLQSEANGTIPAAWNYYGSPLRDAAAIVALAENGNAGPPVIQAALKVISDERAKSRYASTQEMTWMVLAARSIVEQARSVALDVDGSAHQGAFYKVYRGCHTRGAAQGQQSRSDAAPGGGRGVGRTDGARARILQRHVAVARSTTRSTARRSIRRKWQQNTRLVVVLTASRDGSEQTGNFLLVDRLPAGLEIENPQLVATGSTGSLSWLSDTYRCHLHGVPRRSLRRGVHRSKRQARLYRARRGAGPLRAAGRHGRGHVPARTQCDTRHHDDERDREVNMAMERESATGQRRSRRFHVFCALCLHDDPRRECRRLRAVGGDAAPGPGAARRETHLFAAGAGPRRQAAAAVHDQVTATGDCPQRRTMSTRASSPC